MAKAFAFQKRAPAAGAHGMAATPVGPKAGLDDLTGDGSDPRGAAKGGPRLGAAPSGSAQPSPASQDAPIMVTCPKCGDRFDVVHALMQEPDADQLGGPPDSDSDDAKGTS